ncbi:MAG: hypothetical protein Q7U40_07895, partial [Desulfatirhabdiaceae bacterium]|nr:hypothetical protein [Desulfatirhabdiaceae bacterium]
YLQLKNGRQQETKKHGVDQDAIIAPRPTPIQQKCIKIIERFVYRFEPLIYQLLLNKTSLW